MNPYTVAPYLREHQDTQRSGVRYQNWRDHAACRDEDPELFFPALEDDAAAATAQARAICAGCPVRTQCLQFALSSPERFGTWAGLTEVERRGMRPSAPAGPRMCAKKLHVLTAENTYTSTNGELTWCRACRNAAEKRRYQKAKYDREALAATTTTQPQEKAA